MFAVGNLFVELVGLEPTTSAVQVRCSSQLSYGPIFRMQLTCQFKRLLFVEFAVSILF